MDSLLAEFVDSLWEDLLDSCRIVLWTCLDSLTSACVSSGEAEFFCSFRSSVSVSVSFSVEFLVESHVGVPDADRG